MSVRAQEALQLVKELQDVVGMFKVGIQLFTAAARRSFAKSLTAAEGFPGSQISRYTRTP